MNVAVFDCFSGIAGDMTVGALLDAGFEFEELTQEIAKLELRGIRLAKRRTRRGSFVGTKFEVHIRKGHYQNHTSFREICRLIQRSRLKPDVKGLSLEIFHHLARAEGRVHGIPAPQVSFHEVGALDSIADIVGTAVAVRGLGIEKVFVRNLHVGRGQARASHHGRILLPSPGTMELLRGFSVREAPVSFEMVTPTGAAILAALAEKTDSLPELEVQSVGYGAGSQNFKDRPNLLRVTVGELVSPRFKRDRVLVLECNLDDYNPLGFEILYERLFRAGALDVFVTPILMKKMRPAYKLSVLFEHERKDEISQVVFRETTTFGIRFLEMDRYLLERRKMNVKTKFGRVSVKVGSVNGRPHIASPEYADCKKIAVTKQIPFQNVYHEAKRKASRLLAQAGSL